MKTLIRIMLIVVTCFMMAKTYSSTFAQREDFDALCALVAEAQELTVPAAMKAEYISTNIQSRVASEDVIEAYFSLSYVDPESRYHVFKDAAESTLTENWSCEPLKALNETHPSS